jgi:GNAT superfamily N-acetyltransferase
MIDPSLITLRPRQESDTEFLIRLYETSREEELLHIDWKSEEERKIFFQQQYNAQQLHFDSNYDSLDYDIIVYDGKDVGRLVLHRSPEKLHCVDIIIMPDYRKMGIGSTVMQWIEQELEEKNLPATLYFEKTKPYLEQIYSNYGFVTNEDLGTHKYMKRPQPKSDS